VSSLKRNGKRGKVRSALRVELQPRGRAKLVLVPNAFVPPELQNETESQVDAILTRMQEIKRKQAELDDQAQKEAHEISVKYSQLSPPQTPIYPQRLRRKWARMDAMSVQAGALERLYFAYKLAANGLRWISSSELAGVPEAYVESLLEVLHGKAACVEGYEEYATRDIRVILECIKSSIGRIRILES